MMDVDGGMDTDFDLMEEMPDMLGGSGDIDEMFPHHAEVEGNCPPAFSAPQGCASVNPSVTNPHPKHKPSPAMMIAGLSLTEKESVLSEAYQKEYKGVVHKFVQWSECEQSDFVRHLLAKMCHRQHVSVNAYLKPMLQRDFISLLPSKGLQAIAENILSYLDAVSLCRSSQVCKLWRKVMLDGMLWRKLIERNVLGDPIWKGLAHKRGWNRYLFNKVKAQDIQPSHSFYLELYKQVVVEIKNLEDNWRCGQFVLHRINCNSENSKGVYCLQYDDDRIVSGLRDNTIKIWDRESLSCVKVLTGHTGSVLCLQYDEQVIISGSSDATVRVWDARTGELLHNLVHHCEAVLHLRFQNGMMVTCSKDRSIVVWDMVCATEINLKRVLLGHRAAVNVVDFDDKYIVSASGDRTIKVWGSDTCEFIRTLTGHRRGIACLQYRNGLVVSGSSDNTIRLWNIETGDCLGTLEGHQELVRCIRFDEKRIVSGAYDGKIKVWDLQAALDPRTPAATICLKTLVEHTGRVFRLQFDEFQVVSSSHDDTILIWDFLNYRRTEGGPPQAPVSTTNASPPSTAAGASSQPAAPTGALNVPPQAAAAHNNDSTLSPHNSGGSPVSPSQLDQSSPGPNF